MRYETLTGLVFFSPSYLPEFSCPVTVYQREEGTYCEEPEKFHPSDFDLAETYPEAIDYLKEKVVEMEKDLKKLSNPNQIYQIKEETAGQDYTYQKAEEVNTARIIHHENQINILKKKLYRFKTLIDYIKKDKVPDLDFNKQIQKAKMFPITSLIKFNRANFAPCPFHNEKLPSLKYYPKENRWHCFGCNTGGDSIDFFMKLKGVTLSEAIARLNG